MTVSVSAAGRGIEFDWRRYLPAVALFAGLTWFCFGMESIVRPHQHGYRNTLILIPWVSTVALVYGLHDMHRRMDSRFERWAAWSLLGAMAVGVVGQPAFMFHNDALLPLAIVGFIGFVAGTVSFGIALFRAGLLPKALAVGVALTQLGTMAMGLALSPWVPLADDGSYSGAVVHGVVFTSVAIWMLRRERAEVA